MKAYRGQSYTLNIICYAQHSTYKRVNKPTIRLQQILKEPTTINELRVIVNNNMHMFVQPPSANRSFEENWTDIKTLLVSQRKKKILKTKINKGIKEWMTQ